ncbi:hypothetical protein ACHQM5_028504 [Ranunculus cassubicifolius]
MAVKSLTSESIAAIEKKMRMTLDDLIKESKTQIKKESTVKKVIKDNLQRPSNKSMKPFPANSSKIRQFMDSRSSSRHAALNQRRSKFDENQFYVANQAGRQATTPIWRKPIKPLNGHKTPRGGFQPVQKRMAAAVFVEGKKKFNHLWKKKQTAPANKRSVWLRLSVPLGSPENDSFCRRR